MYTILIIILILVAIIAVFSLLAVSAYRKRRVLPEIDHSNCAVEEYFRYVSGITLGAASGESAREFCKAKSIWDNAISPMEALAAFQISDGVSRIILEDAKDRFDKDAYEEIERGYRHRKNNLLWAISRDMKTEDDPQIWKWDDIKETVHNSKNKLFVRFYHSIKPYPRSWENQ